MYLITVVIWNGGFDQCMVSEKYHVSFRGHRTIFLFLQRHENFAPFQWESCHLFDYRQDETLH